MSRARKKTSAKRIPAEFTDAARGVRLQKVLADAGLASRRECETLITAGRVKVNGKLVTAMPAWVDPDADRVHVDGEPLTRSRSGRKTYILLNKPKRVVSTTRDPQGRTTVSDLVKLPPSIAKRLYPVGRLDAESTGLILLTNDGELANRLTHPRYEVAKQYRLSVKGRLSEDDVQQLQKGLLLSVRPKGRDTPPRARRATMAKVVLLGYQRDRTRGDRTELMVTLHEGQNREIRRMVARLGHKVRRLERVAIGSLKLKGLAVGEWRMLSAVERRRLKKTAGLK